MRVSATLARTRASTAWSGVHAQAALLAVGYLIRTAGAFALVVVLSRTIGAAGYGRVSVYIAVSWAAFYLPASWVLISVPALSPRRHGRRVEREVVWSTVVVGAAGVALACVLVILALAASEQLRATLPAGSEIPLVLSAFGLLALNAVYVVHQANRRAGSVALLQSLERLLAAALVGASLLAFDADEEAISWALAAATLLTAGASVTSRAMRSNFGRPVVASATVGEAVRFGAPLAVSNVCAYLVGWVDVLIIALALGPTEAGVYSVAYQLYALLTGLTSAWLQAAVPERAQALGGEAPSRDAAVRGATTWSAAVGVFAFVAVVLFVPVFGAEFREGVAIAALLLLAASILAPYYAAAPQLMVDGRARVVMWASVVSAGLNLAIDVVLVWSLGLWAGAIGTLCQTVVAVTWIVVVVYGARTLRPLAAAQAPVALALVALTIDPGAALTRVLALVLVVGSVGHAVPVVRRHRR